MFNRIRFVGLILVIFLLSACVAPGGLTPLPPTQASTLPPVASPTTSLPASSSPTPGEPAATPATETVSPTAPTAPDVRRDESIMILQPASGSLVVSPIQLSGISDPAFEGTLEVSVLSVDGEMLFQSFTNIQADMGQRGPFSVEIPLGVAVDTNVFIQVYMTSPRDGGITHLSSVGVILSPTGPANIRMNNPYPERITILSPLSAASISGGVLNVEGFGLASFEQTLLVELLDEDGAVLSSTPVNVRAPDLGQPGTFFASLPYSVSHSMPGRVVVRDISPAFGGDVHRTSIEVTLNP